MRCELLESMPATARSSRSSRGSVARAIAISSCRCSPCARLAARRVGARAEPTASSTRRAGSRERRLLAGRAPESKAPAAVRLHGERHVVEGGELAEDARDLEGRARPSRDRSGASRRVTSWPAKRMAPASDAGRPRAAR